MNLRPLLYLSITAGLMISLLAGLAFLPSFLSEPSQPYLHFNNVSGMAIEHNQKLFTLNFDQQNDVIKFINTATPNAKPVFTNIEKLPYDKLVVYRFDAPDIEAATLGFENNQLIFQTPEWNKNQPLMERSGGLLKKLLEQTYD